MVAGAAVVLAAAFNTPLAGVTFAIEELTGDYFANIKDFVLMAIIIAALSAKALTGEYTYFGQLLESPDVSLFATFVIGARRVSWALFSLPPFSEDKRRCRVIKPDTGATPCRWC